MKAIVTAPLLVFAITAACSRDAPSAQGPEPAAQTEPARASGADPVEGGAGTETDTPRTKDSALPIFEAPIRKLGADEPTTLAEHQGKALLIVNVASKCGLTPQYEALEALHEKYGDRGFAVLAFPSNQFGGQEPGTAEEIKSFCTSNYGVSFPMYEKIDVNGGDRHPIYDALTQKPDASGEAGDIQWNFEKFVIAADGETVTRFRPKTVPDDPAVVAAIEAGLP